MRKVKLHRGVWKPKLFLGCEKTPFLIIGISSMILIVEGSFTAKIVGVIYFFLMLGIIVYLNKKDPFFFKIGYRFLIKQQTFYASSASYPSKPDEPNNKDDKWI